MTHNDALITGGATIVGAVIGGLFLLMRKKKDPDQVSSSLAVTHSNLSAGNVAVGGHISQENTTHHHHYSSAADVGTPISHVSSSVTLAQIEADFQSATAYQRVSFGDHWIGIPIRWQLSFLRMSNIGDEWKVSLVTLGDSRPWINIVSAKVDLEKTPELKIARRDQLAWIEGKIESISSDIGIVHIKDAKITLL